MRKIISFLLLSAGLAVAVAGCNSSAEDSNGYLIPEVVYDKATPITGEDLSTEYMARNAPNDCFTPYGIFGKTDIQGKNIHLVNAESGAVIASALSRGRGPQEVLMPMGVDYHAVNDRFYACCGMTNSILEYRFENDSLIFTNRYNLSRKVQSVIDRFKVGADSTFVMYLTRMKSNHLFIVDAHNRVHDSLDYMPFSDERLDVSKIKRNNITMAMDRDRETLFICNATYNTLQKYSVKENKFELLKEQMFLEPHLDLSTGAPKAEDNHIIGDGKIFMGEKYLYVVSNPETAGEFRARNEEAKKQHIMLSSLAGNSYILVFDYDFNFVKSYICDTHFTSISIAPDGKTIYAANEENQRLRKFLLHLRL